ncbi:MAG: hypothetical protein LBV43_11100 [Prevotella sp.]|jgi:hypothetical protein|nr:hypothetical protein [Prevotella sp.]
MGYIKEPKGVDFAIESEIVTEEDKMEISKYIKEYKTKSSLKPKERKSVNKSKKEKV